MFIINPETESKKKSSIATQKLLANLGKSVLYFAILKGLAHYY